jgi:hypothetical protein
VNRVSRVSKQYGERAAEQVAAREEAVTWGKGSAGEARLAGFIEREVDGAVIALHDRGDTEHAK